MSRFGRDSPRAPFPGTLRASEESFVLELHDGGEVTFTISAFSRPNSLLARIGGPPNPRRSVVNHEPLLALGPTERRTAENTDSPSRTSCHAASGADGCPRWRVLIPDRSSRGRRGTAGTAPRSSGPSRHGCGVRRRPVR
ncbi:DUF1990 family protein [Tessaracoccus sp. ZS01]|uniref:DUF1990 family protein n=1 Tax=Tessaracoccus sp. ZS01 TaxID=1906324 RepID=UPI00096C7717|nr:hypothetical protein BJN44_08760 [Tessaracoccus sp. ZS01]